VDPAQHDTDMTETRATRIAATAAPLAAGLALLAGLGAAVRDDDARRLLAVAALVAALVMAWLLQVAVRRLPPTTLAGAGYEPPRGFWPQAVHAAATLLYVVGIMAFVLAALMRWLVIEPVIPRGLVQWLPALGGGYALVLYAAAWQRLRQRRAVAPVWTSRVHGFAFGPVAALGVVFAVSLVAGPRDIMGVRFGESDLMLVALLLHLGIGTQVMLAYGLPTLMDVLTRLFRPHGDVAPTPPVVYAAVLAGVAGVSLWYTFLRFEVWQRVVPSIQAQNAVALAAAIPIAALVFFGYAVIGARLQSRRNQQWRRPERPTPVKLAIGAGAGLGVLAGLAAVLLITGAVAQVGPWRAGIAASQDLLSLSVLLLLMPAGVWLQRRSKREAALEERLPDLLHDLAEGRRAGLPLARAIEGAARNDYGPLGDDVHKLSTQVAWGVAVTNALDRFADRTATPLFRRAVVLVREAVHSGGPLTDVLRGAAHQARQASDARRERRAALGTYLIVLYVTFFVFLFVIGVLEVQFLPRLIEAKAVGVAGLGSHSALSLDSLRFSYFGAVLVQAVGTGIVGGILVERRAVAGFIHASIMTIAAWVTFRLILGVVFG
jgi:flagellar protein FlaJ